MSELPDFKKIEFPDMPPIPLEEVVPDASPEVSSINLHVIACRVLLSSYKRTSCNAANQGQSDGAWGMCSSYICGRAMALAF